MEGKNPTEILGPGPSNNPLERSEGNPRDREIEGIYNATNFIQQKVRSGEDCLDREDLFQLHRLVMNDPINPQKWGVLRTSPATITTRINGELLNGHIPPDTFFLSEEFNEFSEEFKDKVRNLSADTPVAEVLGAAAWSHMKFVYIHPFNDGNGRTARLLVDYVFRKARLPYIRDWGSKADEYKEVVFNAVRSSTGHEIFRGFLSEKLDARIKELEVRLGTGKLNEDFSSIMMARIRGNVKTAAR